MPIVLTRCPATEKIVSTIYRMKANELAELTGSRAFRCSACGRIHNWVKDDAWLEPERT